MPEMAHAITDAQGQFQNVWARAYEYATAPPSNHLLYSTIGTARSTYAHDAAGNTTRMPHRPSLAPDGHNLEWDGKNQLVRATIAGGEAYFAYDASGQRVRKVEE